MGARSSELARPIGLDPPPSVITVPSCQPEIKSIVTAPPLPQGAPPHALVSTRFGRPFPGTRTLVEVKTEPALRRSFPVEPVKPAVASDSESKLSAILLEALDTTESRLAALSEIKDRLNGLEQGKRDLEHKIGDLATRNLLMAFGVLIFCSLLTLWVFFTR